MSTQEKLRKQLRELSVKLPMSEQEKELALIEADKAWRLLVRQTGYSCFSEEVLGFTNAPHQEEWYGVLDNRRLRKIAVAAPRGHTKSTCFTVNYPLGRIAEDHNVRILIVTNAEIQGQAFLREITSQIERNQTYVDYAGQLRPTATDDNPVRWTNREIIITRERIDLKDPTISTVGVGGTILAKRADEIICDDILSPENTRTPEQRQKLKEWFYQVLLPVLRPGGRLIFVGTVWHPDDLLNEILADPSWDYRKKFQAVIKWPTDMELWQKWYGIRMAGTPESADAAIAFFYEHQHELAAGMEILWKEFGFLELYKIYRGNRIAFEKAYQNNIISREDQKFKEEWLDRAKARGAGLRLIGSLSTDQRKEFKILTAGIDLAASEEEQADDNAMLSLGLRRLDDMVQVLGLARGQFTPKKWRGTIVERDEGFLHDRIVVETNGYQVALKRDIVERNLPIVGFTTGGEKFDPYIGVESLAILFENDRIILPYDKTDPTTIALVDQLVDELRQFPVGHTGDSAMALWFAYTAMRDLIPASGGEHGFLQMVKQDMEKAKAAGGTPQSLAGWMAAAQKQKQQ